MKCPFCYHQESKVVDSRPSGEGDSIRRRRECLECHKRFTTYEIMERMPIIVVKKNGSRQSFDRNKLVNSVFKSCEKRAISLSSIEKLAESIEQELQNELDGEVTSDCIGGLVMEKLREIDEVAYVRFAAVYRRFKDIQTFRNELNKLLEDETPVEDEC